MTSTAPSTSGTLAVPDGTLYYKVRGSGPLFVLVGAPMDHGPFGPVAGLLAFNYTVLTPEPRAEDLAALISNLGVGPAIVLGSSGGAVTGLALALSHPEVVSTLIAHEPPLRELLADRAELRATTEDIQATYLAGDHIGAIRKFFAMTGVGMPEEVVQQMFGAARDPRTLADELYFYE